MSITEIGLEVETDLGTFDVVYRGRGLLGLKYDGWEMVLPVRVDTHGEIHHEDLRAVLHIAQLVYNAVGPMGNWPPDPAHDEAPDLTRPDAVIVDGKFIGYRVA